MQLASSIVEALVSASPEDIKEIDKELGRIRKQLRELMRTRDALQTARELLAKRFASESNDKTEPGPADPSNEGGRKRRARRNVRQERRRRLYDYLIQHPGGVYSGELHKAIDVPQGSMHSLLSHEAFKRLDYGLWTAKPGYNGDFISREKVEP